MINDDDDNYYCSLAFYEYHVSLLCKCNRERFRILINNVIIYDLITREFLTHEI